MSTEIPRDRDGDADASEHAALEALVGAIDDWLSDLTTLGATLNEMQATMLPVDFEAWTLAAGLDLDTVHEFIAFDGTLTSVTDRMLAALQRVVAALN